MVCGLPPEFDFSLHPSLLLLLNDHLKTPYFVNIVRLQPSTTTQVEVQAATIEVLLFVGVPEVSGVMEVEANQIGIKEINNIKNIGRTHNHGIHRHVHTPRMV
uniref:Uncharacterized protein n=1 Tax=Lactuca sativa TaxID=4236 RepID=A0A9R1XAL3_LACSA|nr:hypothetical protein LSAT_V11C500264310 [Lactuca sativa]